jgi:hypothetical protein
LKNFRVTGRSIFGFILIGKDGGVVKVWAFVDNFLVHGPTYKKTSRALTLFLDLAVDCGMLCHPTELTPPHTGNGKLRHGRFLGGIGASYAYKTLHVPSYTCL